MSKHSNKSETAQVRLVWDVNILNPGSHRDHIIPLFGGHFKIWVVSLYMPKNPVSHHGWETKKILQFGLSKTAFSAIFHTIFYSKI